eukprot:31210-Pelagococcus_subviridis.AAC.8
MSSAAIAPLRARVACCGRAGSPSPRPFREKWHRSRGERAERQVGKTDRCGGRDDSDTTIRRAISRRRGRTAPRTGRHTKRTGTHALPKTRSQSSTRPPRFHALEDRARARRGRSVPGEVPIPPPPNRPIDPPSRWESPPSTDGSARNTRSSSRT